MCIITEKKIQGSACFGVSVSIGNIIVFCE